MSVDVERVFAGIGPIGWGAVVVLAMLSVVSAWLAHHPLDWKRLPLVSAAVRFLPTRLDAAAGRPRARLGISGVAMGHATGAAAIGLLGAWMLCRWVVRQWPAQVAVWAGTIAVIGLIGFSRCYLGVHFVTDVMAGWLLGAGWAGSVILLASWWTRATSPARESAQPGAVSKPSSDRFSTAGSGRQSGSGPS